MVQDFAKKQPAADEAEPVPAPSPGKGMLLTGLFSGLALGMLLSFLIYLSGVLPPLPEDNTSVAESDSASAQANQGALDQNLEEAAARLQLDFYQELPNYEVMVEAEPLSEPDEESDSEAAAADPTPDTANQEGGYVVQAGAFQQEEAARAQAERLRQIGLQVRVRQEALLGRNLFLVQSGPYASREELLRAERTLDDNNIDNMRISPSRR